jgi:hypothetical protein
MTGNGRTGLLGIKRDRTKCQFGLASNHGDRTKCQFGLTRTGAVSYGQAVG